MLMLGLPDAMGVAQATPAVETSVPLSIGNPSSVDRGPVMPQGGVLLQNQYLSSSNGVYEFDIFPSGVAVLWAMLPGTQPCPMAIMPPPTSNVMSDEPWTLQSTPQLDSYLILQTDNNLVLYAPDGSATWASDTNSYAGKDLTLNLLDNGDLAIIADGGGALWHLNDGRKRGPILCSKNVLLPGQFLVQPAYMSNPWAPWYPNAAAGEYALGVAATGELVLGLYQAGEPGSLVNPTLLARGPGGSQLTMQPGGDLVYAGPKGAVLWTTRTRGHAGAVALLSNWGDLWVVDPQTNIILYDSSGKSVGQTVGAAAATMMNP
jgi:hypothetical protein